MFLAIMCKHDITVVHKNEVGLHKASQRRQRRTELRPKVRSMHKLELDAKPVGDPQRDGQTEHSAFSAIYRISRSTKL